MIKLNNKNITYVALADSNNSVKGVKEIWYADTNNSVKLVYRRKDALIEGEDYEKYHWLVGDKSSYIDVPRSNEVTDVIHFKVDTSNSGLEGVRGIFGNIRLGTGVNNNTIHFVKYNSDYMACRAFNSDNELRPTRYSVMSVDILTDSVKVNSDTYELNRGTTALEGYSMPIFSRRRINDDLTTNITKEIIAASLAYFKIDNVLDLIPCKLLKPVPKWLDANGIRRNIGECGMIDLVSGKFYGNVNSVGTFTVENYYERKEWLIGDGSAYIDTDVIVNSSTLKLELQYRLGNESIQPIFGSRDNARYESQNTVLWVTDYTKFRLDLLSEGNSVQHCNALVVNSIEFDATVPKVTINGSEFTSNKSFTNSVNTFRIFDLYLRDNTYKYADGSMSYFKLNDGTNKLDLIPCTLTMDLPASMDANNIARTKGTSGMWDLVSDKFYGNVANNGTFKAVNLAEGVDYEVHQWLVGDDIAYIQGVTYDVWNNKIQLKTGKWDGEARSILVYDKEGKPLNINKNTDSTGTYLMFIFREDGSNYAHIGDIRPFSAVPDNLEVEFFIKNAEFYCKQNGVVIPNTQPQTAVQGSWTLITPKIYSAKMSYIREVLPDGSSYRSNLIPVKLLHSIPSKYDANGIARQSGECGMYDTVNDVFYGNVASSGTFSVSDDS